jgi:hypothetical protein
MVRNADGASHEAPVSDRLSLFPGPTRGTARPPTLMLRALRGGQRAFLLVDNKADGSAPLTIEGIAARLLENGVQQHSPSSVVRCR